MAEGCRNIIDGAEFPLWILANDVIWVGSLGQYTHTITQTHIRIAQQGNPFMHHYLLFTDTDRQNIISLTFLHESNLMNAVYWRQRYLCVCRCVVNTPAIAEVANFAPFMSRSESNSMTVAKTVWCMHSVHCNSTNHWKLWFTLCSTTSWRLCGCDDRQRTNWSKQNDK